MENIKAYIYNTKYWLYTICATFLIFMICYHGLSIGVRLIVPFILVAFMANVLDVKRALVFATIVSSILALTVIKYHMFYEYWMLIGFADIIIVLQIIMLIIHKTMHTSLERDRDIFKWPLLLYFVGAVLSIFFAKNKLASISFLTLMVTGYLFYRYIMVVFQNDNLKWLLSFIFVMIFLIFIWAFVNKASRPIDVHAGIAIESRAGYVFTGPNGLAAVVVILIPFCFMVFSLKNIWLKIAIGLLFAGGIYLLLITYSRNGYISFLISTTIMVIIYAKKKSFPFIITSILVILPFAVFIIIGASIMSRLFTVSAFSVDPSALFRLIMWRSAINMFGQNPLTGIGLGNFYYVTELFNSGFCHNLYLNSLAEMGIIGGISVIWFLVTVFYYLFQVLGKPQSNFMQNVNICLIGSWTAFTINNIFDQVFFFLDRTAEMKIFWFLTAITALFILETRNARSEN